MGGPRRCFARWKGPDTEDHGSAWLHLQDPQRQNQISSCQGLGGRAEGEWLHMGTDLGGSLLHMHFALGHTQPPEFRNCSQNFSPALRDYFKQWHQHKAQGGEIWHLVDREKTELTVWELNPAAEWSPARSTPVCKRLSENQECWHVVTDALCWEAEARTSAVMRTDRLWRTTVVGMSSEEAAASFWWSSFQGCSWRRVSWNFSRMCSWETLSWLCLIFHQKLRSIGSVFPSTRKQEISHSQDELQFIT